MVREWYGIDDPAIPAGLLTTIRCSSSYATSSGMSSGLASTGGGAGILHTMASPDNLVVTAAQGCVLER